MTIAKTSARASCLSAVMVLAVIASAVAGCSNELASIDDVYVPTSAEENYPIKVVERPVRVAFDADKNGLRPADVEELTGLAQQAATRAATPVTVSYASGSLAGKKASEQIMAILSHKGVPRSAVMLHSVKGKSDMVTIGFVTRIAVTKPCGDWSQDTRTNQLNGVGPNFGCAFQQNLAASVTDPGDFVRPKPTTPGQSAALNPAIATYQSGEWTAPAQGSGSGFDAGSGSGSGSGSGGSN